MVWLQLLIGTAVTWAVLVPVAAAVEFAGPVVPVFVGLGMPTVFSVCMRARVMTAMKYSGDPALATRLKAGYLCVRVVRNCNKSEVAKAPHHTDVILPPSGNIILLYQQA